MAQLKFFRGQRSADASLPSRDNGSVFVIKREDAVGEEIINGVSTPIYGGDLYVDINDGKRLQIMPEANIDYMDKERWNNIPSRLVSIKGKLYICKDYVDYEVIDESSEDEDKKHIKLPGIKIGDGTSFVVDLPICVPVIQSEKDFWNNKVSVDIARTSPLSVQTDGTPHTSLELFPDFENFTLVFSDKTNMPYIGPGTN